MSDTRIKPHAQQQLARTRRSAQVRLFRRNQGIGLLLLAIAILVWWIFHTHQAWLFPAGWARP